MFRRLIVVIVMVSLVMLMASTCWAADVLLPSDITTTQQVIDKYFTGRTLDPIEGIWVRDEKNVITIIKTSVVAPQNPKYAQFDYLVISTKCSGNKFGELGSGLKKTQYTFSFIGSDFSFFSGYWEVICQNVLEFHEGDYVGIVSPTSTFVRTYPTP